MHRRQSRPRKVSVHKYLHPVSNDAQQRQQQIQRQQHDRNSGANRNSKRSRPSAYAQFSNSRTSARQHDAQSTTAPSFNSATGQLKAQQQEQGNCPINTTR